MFFPFTNYTVIDFTFGDPGPALAHTLSKKSWVQIEMINAGTTGEYYDCHMYGIQTLAASITTTLLQFSGSNNGGSNTITQNGGSILEAGTPIYMTRGEQYSATIIKIHIFELPA